MRNMIKIGFCSLGIGLGYLFSQFMPRQAPPHFALGEKRLVVLENRAYTLGELCSLVEKSLRRRHILARCLENVRVLVFTTGRPVPAQEIKQTIADAVGEEWRSVGSIEFLPMSSAQGSNAAELRKSRDKLLHWIERYSEKADILADPTLGRQWRSLVGKVVNYDELPAKIRDQIAFATAAALAAKQTALGGGTMQILSPGSKTIRPKKIIFNAPKALSLLIVQYQLVREDLKLWRASHVARIDFPKE